MKKLISSSITTLLIVSAVGTSVFASDVESVDAVEPVYVQLTSENLQPQYATGVEYGTKRTDIDLSSYSSKRLIPENALGEFDAIKKGATGDQYFFSTVSYDKTLYTFDNGETAMEFYNVSDTYDLKLCEVTWPQDWYAEGVQIYLKDAYVLKDGKVVKYDGNDNGLGYFAGTAWNREGIRDLTADTRNAYNEAIVAGRQYNDSNAYTEENLTYTEFNFPDEVVKASGIYFVDMDNQVKENVDKESPYYNYYRSRPGGFDLDAMCVFAKEKKALKLQYATAYETGSKNSTLNLSIYPSKRLNPENALGAFDAIKTGANGDSKFYSTVAYDKTLFTFNDPDADKVFYNVNGSFDMKLCEVTWPADWYIEGVQVYLKDAYIYKDGEIVKYDCNDNGLGYFAGIAWNREGIRDLSANALATYNQSIVAGRNYNTGTAYTDHNFTYTEINFPDEVVSASGVYLVDMYGLINENLDSTSLYFRAHRSRPGGYDVDAMCVYVDE